MLSPSRQAVRTASSSHRTESLRPPAANQTKETKGRKSNKRAAAKDGKGSKKKKGKGKQGDESEEEVAEEEEEEDLDEALDNMEDEPTYVAKAEVQAATPSYRTSRRRAAQSIPVA
jgi:hypothetical protein